MKQRYHAVIYRGFRLVEQADGSYVVFRVGEESQWCTKRSLSFAKGYVDDRIAVLVEDRFVPRTGSGRCTVMFSNGVAAI